MIRSAATLLLCVISCSIAAGETNRDEPPLVRSVRARLPAGWTCTVFEGDAIKQVPHGLQRPLFLLVAANTHVSFNAIPDSPPGARREHPVIPLCFYPKSAKADLMRVIEKESCYSWDIPIYFGETDEFIVVTSPAYVNGGVFTHEARRALRPMWNVLRDLIPKREETLVDDLAAEE